MHFLPRPAFLLMPTLVLQTIGFAPHLLAANEMDGSRVLVVYRTNGVDADNDGMVDSEQLARHYALKRQVPQGNLLPVRISVPYDYYNKGEYAKFFADIVAPIRGALATLGGTNIDVILLAGEIPTVVYDANNRLVGLDAALMGINSLGSAATSAIPSGNNPYFQPSAGFGTDMAHFSHALYKYQQADMYIVTRLGGNSSLRGINQVDQSVYADKYLYPLPGYYNGIGYVDSQWGNASKPYTHEYLASQPAVQSGSFLTSTQADMNIAYTARFIEAAGFPLKWENTTNSARIGEATARYSDGSSALVAPRALFYGGWYNFMRYADVFEWLPGSVACDVNSTFTFGTEALKKGATAAAYVVGEPYLGGHQRPHLLMYYLLNGLNFAEASALATPKIGWVSTNEGDPLYSPTRPGKVPVLDTRAPVLSAGYPRLVVNPGTGHAVLTVAVDDSADPEVITARVEYGNSSAYGSVSVSSGGFSRIAAVSMPWTLGQIYHYRVILTDPAGNVTTTGNYVYETAASVKIQNPATASASPVTGTAVALSALGSSTAGESGLTYMWSATGPAPVTFSSNGSNTSKNTIATFRQAGSYSFQVNVKDASGSGAMSATTVQVTQTVAELSVSPSSATVNVKSTQQYTASALDQFGLPVNQPSITWTASGGGTISPAALFTAGTTVGGPYVITGKAGQVSGTAAMSVVDSNQAGSSGQLLFHLAGELAELSGTVNGSVVRPAAGPAGTLAVAPSGSVNFAASLDSNGVYFLNCCSNSNSAHYRFAGTVVGDMFDTAGGQISFNITSRRTWAARLAAGSYRVVFDVQNKSEQLFTFFVLPASKRLAFAYRAGSNAATYYYVPAGKEDQLFGSGATARVRLTWDGTKQFLYVNDALVSTSAYTRSLSTWSATSVFTIGARDYLNAGGYNASDDIIISEVKVSRP